MRVFKPFTFLSMLLCWSALVGVPLTSWAVCDAELAEVIASDAALTPGQDRTRYARETTESHLSWLKTYPTLQKAYLQRELAAAQANLRDAKKPIERTTYGVPAFRAKQDAEKTVRRRWDIAVATIHICRLNHAQSGTAGSASNNQPITEPDNRIAPKPIEPGQALVNDALQRTRNTQARGDASAQRASRRTHDPAAEAHDCLSVDSSGLFGFMVNQCAYKVNYTFCAYKPRDEKALNSGWLTGMNCEKQQFGADDVGANNKRTQHTKGAESLFWFACKDPAWALDVYFENGGIKGRCRVVGG